MSTGLFLVRRERTCITRRISWSRPMTGSSLPCLARSTRSMPYRSRAWNLPSGFWSVTRALPRTACSACRISWSPMALSFSTLRALESTLVRASSRCSVETNSSFIDSASLLRPLRKPGCNAGEGCGCAPPLTRGQMPQLGLRRSGPIAGDWRRFAPARADHAVALGQQRRQQVQRFDLRVAAVGGQVLAPAARLLGP